MKTITMKMDENNKKIDKELTEVEGRPTSSKRYIDLVQLMTINYLVF